MRAMYPDFLVVRSGPGRQLVVDIVDPHAISLADAPAKAAGLAQFAARHAGSFGRIELVMVDGTHEKRVDLCDERTRQRLQGIKLASELRTLFEAL